MSHEPSKYDIVPLEQAFKTMLAQIRPSRIITIDYQEALGFVLAEDIYAVESIPSFPCSAVDGYAIRSADGKQLRPIIGEQAAGGYSNVRVEPQTAIRITTGAPIPPGADGVIMLEYTDVQEENLVTHQEIAPGANIRPIGTDIQEGEKVLAVGQIIGPAEIGVLATLGRINLQVYHRPIVAVLATGDELVDPRDTPGPGQIRDSNQFALLAAITLAGCTPLSLGRVNDDENLLRTRIHAGLAQADALVTSGGVSVGKFDLIKKILAEMGTIHFGRVKMKPGKPVTFVTVPEYGNKPVFGLPGFPVASLVSFELFVRPALRKMRGLHKLRRARVEVILEHPISHTEDRVEYQRAVVTQENGLYFARTTGAQGSGRLVSLVGANALLELPLGTSSFGGGERVEALMLEWPEIE